MTGYPPKWETHRFGGFFLFGTIADNDICGLSAEASGDSLETGFMTWQEIGKRKLND